MKQGRFYLAAAILLLASGCEKEDGENTDDSKWTHPLTTTLHRTDPGGEQSTYVITYTYDAKDRLTGTRNSRDGVTETTTSDYVYDGKTVTYTEKHGPVKPCGIRKNSNALIWMTLSKRFWKNG